jgi:hypothetical protein
MAREEHSNSGSAQRLDRIGTHDFFWSSLPRDPARGGMPLGNWNHYPGRRVIGSAAHGSAQIAAPSIADRADQCTPVRLGENVWSHCGQ